MSLATFPTVHLGACLDHQSGFLHVLPLSRYDSRGSSSQKIFDELLHISRSGVGDEPDSTRIPSNHIEKGAAHADPDW